MAPASGLRIGDADREAAVASLREHFAVGRLTLEEFQHRLDAALSAKTDRDLADITGDLPHPAASPHGLPATLIAGTGRAGTGQGGSRRSWLTGVAGLIAVVLAVVVVALLLPVGLFGMALSRSLLFVLAALLLRRRGLLRWLRGWVPRSRRRRWPL